MYSAGDGRRHLREDVHLPWHSGKVELSSSSSSSMTSFTRRCPIPIHVQSFSQEKDTICQDGVADLLRLGELVQQYQAAGGEDHQVGRSLILLLLLVLLVPLVFLPTIDNFK